MVAGKNGRSVDGPPGGLKSLVPLTIQLLAIGSADAPSDSAVVQPVQVVLVQQGCGDIGTGAALPQKGIFPQLATATQLHREGTGGAESSKTEDDLIAHQDAGADISGQAMGCVPTEFSIVGVQPPDLPWGDDDQNVLPICIFGDQRSAVGEFQDPSLSSPSYLSRFGLQSEDRALLLGSVDDHKIFVKDQAGR